MPQVKFYPSPSQIASISNAVKAIVVTTAPHNLDDGTRIRFIVPSEYGMQINNLRTFATVIDSVTLQTTLDTRNMDAFVVPTQTFVFPEPAQIIAIDGPGNNLASQNLGTL